MTLPLRSLTQGSYGRNQVVFAPGDFNSNNAEWWQDGSAHETLGIEDLDDVAMPVVAMPAGGVAMPGGSGTGGIFGNMAQMVNNALGLGVAQSPMVVGNVAQPMVAGNVAQPNVGNVEAWRPSISGGGAVATPVLADGSAGGKKDFYAEAINPEHPQYNALRAGLQTMSPGGVQDLAKNIQEGIAQAALGTPANSWLGSLLGAGVGGPGLGTGPLTGTLQRRALDLFGQSGLPAAAYWDAGRLSPTEYAQQPQWQNLARDVDSAGRMTAERILGVTQPQIDGIRTLLEHRANQVQATGEHRSLAKMDGYMREVLSLLQHIALRTGARTARDFAIANYAQNQTTRRY